jgi:predicted dehydrogenase
VLECERRVGFRGLPSRNRKSLSLSTLGRFFRAASYFAAAVWLSLNILGPFPIDSFSGNAKMTHDIANLPRISRRAVLAGLPLAAAASAVKLPGKVRVAILGLVGHTGEITGPLASLPDVEIAGIFDSDPELLKRFQPRNPNLTKTRRYSDYRRMLDAEKPDVVAVCNDNGGRAEAILECVERKMHVVAEKPLATKREDFLRVKAAVAARGVKLGMLLPLRYTPPFLALKQIVDSGEIGEVGLITSQKSYRAGTRPKWMVERATYGSTILWIGPHMVDLMLFASGGRDFTQAFSYQANVGLPQVGAMETTTVTAFRMDNGGTATLHMDYYRPETAPSHGDDRLRLAGTKGVAEYIAATGVTVLSTGNKPRVIEQLPAKRSLFSEFLDHVYNGKPASLSQAEIYRCCEVVLGAHESAEQGRPVNL